MNFLQNDFFEFFTYNWPILADTEELAHTAGTIVGAIGLIVMLGSAFRLYKNFKDTGKRQSLFLGGMWAGFGIAALMVGLEQIFFQIMDDPNDAKDIAILFAILAFIFGIAALISSNLFAVSFFSEEKMKLIIIPAILAILGLIYWLITIKFNGSGVPSPAYGPWHDTGVDFDMYRTGAEKFILFLILAIPVFLMVAVLAYATIKVKAQPPLFKRSILLTIFQFFVCFFYLVEVIGTDFMDFLMGDSHIWLIVIGRFCYVLVPLAVYFVYTMPQWFKNLIGWE